MVITASKKNLFLFSACLLLSGASVVSGITPTSGTLIVSAKIQKAPRWVKPNKLKVYKSASTSSKVVAILKKDDKVIWYTPYPPSGSWAKVRYKKGKFGYVKRSGLKTRCSLEGWVKYAQKEQKKLKQFALERGWSMIFETEVTVRNRELFGKEVLFSMEISNNDYRLNIRESSSPSDQNLFYDVSLSEDNGETYNSIGVGPHRIRKIHSFIEKYTI